MERFDSEKIREQRERPDSMFVRKWMDKTETNGTGRLFATVSMLSATE